MAETAKMQQIFFKIATTAKITKLKDKTLCKPDTNIAEYTFTINKRQLQAHAQPCMQGLTYLGLHAGEDNKV